MAQKRMFSLHVVDTDRFMDMPTSAQALYFHLGMHGDDDGFVASPRKIARAAGCAEGDIATLAAEGFIIRMDDGVVVITDWKVNNAIKKDRYTQTLYQAQKSRLQEDESGRYYVNSNMEPDRNHIGTNMEPDWNRGDSMLEPQYSIDKGSVDEDSIDTDEGSTGQNRIDKHSSTAGRALSADCIKSTAGIIAPDLEKSKEMIFEDQRNEAIQKLLASGK